MLKVMKHELYGPSGSVTIWDIMYPIKINKRSLWVKRLFSIYEGGAIEFPLKKEEPLKISFIDAPSISKQDVVKYMFNWQGLLKIIY